MPKSKEPKFEENLKRLESIVDQLENKEAPLDQSLALFEEGVRLARACQQTLEQAKKKVEVLIKETGELKPNVRGNAIKKCKYFKDFESGGRQGRIQESLKYDKQFASAVKILNNPKQYSRILN